MLRHVRVKCFVKLCDFLILEMPKQVQRKLAIFKNWLKRFSCSVSNSHVHQWKVSHGFPSCRQRTQATGGKGKWWGKELLRYLLCSWAGRTTVALPWRESKDTGCWFPQLHRNEEIHKAFLKGCICGLCSPLSSVPSEKSPSPANSGKALHFRMWGISLYLNSLLHELWFRPPARLSLCVEMNGAMQIFTGSGSVLLYVC